MNVRERALTEMVIIDNDGTSTRSRLGPISKWGNASKGRGNVGHRILIIPATMKEVLNRAVIREILEVVNGIFLGRPSGPTDACVPSCCIHAGMSPDVAVSKIKMLSVELEQVGTNISVSISVK